MTNDGIFDHIYYSSAVLGIDVDDATILEYLDSDDEVDLNKFVDRASAVVNQIIEDESNVDLCGGLYGFPSSTLVNYYEPEEYDVGDAISTYSRFDIIKDVLIVNSGSRDFGFDDDFVFGDHGENFNVRERVKFSKILFGQVEELLKYSRKLGVLPNVAA